jgi:hypothetical protein
MECPVVELFCVTYVKLLFGRRRISPDRLRRVWGLFGGNLNTSMHSRSAHAEKEEQRRKDSRDKGVRRTKIPKDSQSTWILTLLTMTMYSPERLPVPSLLLRELAGLLGLCRLFSVNREP